MNYNNEELLEKYISKVKFIREDSLLIKPKILIEQISAFENKMFDFSKETGFSQLSLFFEELKNIRNELLIDYYCNLIVRLKQEHTIKVINNTPTLSIITLNSNEVCLYYFKDYGIPTEIDKYYVMKLKETFKPTAIYYVSLTTSNPRSCYFNQCEDSELELSLHEFFENNFNINEFENFINFEREYTKRVKEIISYKTVKPLTGSTLFGFTQYIVAYLQSDNFIKKVIDSDMKIGISNNGECSIVFDNFFNVEHYKALIRNSNFSRSIISAEWMYHSIKEINNIDYTVISLGYFKSLEQFLYDYIKTHSGEDRKIKRMKYSNLDDKPTKIFLNDNSISNGYINNMLDSMITFLQDYPDLFITNINEKVISGIIDILNEAKKLRNGYLHKDNMTNWEVVEKSRDITYLSLYYLLGSLKMEDKQKKAFNISNLIANDFDKLNNYLHNNTTASIYYIRVDGQSFIAQRLKDEYREFDEYNEMHYSGIYFNRYLNVPYDTKHILLRDIPKIQKISIKLEHDNPTLIIEEGKIEPYKNGISLSGPNKKIYENKKFVGKENLVIEDF